MEEIKKYNIDDLYIGLERKEEYSEFLEEYELWEEHVILEKTNYNLILGDTDINVYSNISDDNRLYIDSDGYVINSKDEITGEERYHQICNLISLKELLNRFKNDTREGCQYRRYVTPIYEKVSNVLENSDSIDSKSLNKIFGNINDIHSYVFELISEDEYEELFGCKTYDFKTGCRVRK